MPKKAASPPAVVEINEPHGSARAKLTDRVTKGRALQAPTGSGESWEAAYDRWDDFNQALLSTLFTTSEVLQQYNWSTSDGSLYVSIGNSSPYVRDTRGHLQKQINCLLSIVEKVEVYPLSAAAKTAIPTSEPAAQTATIATRQPGEILNRLLDRFHTVAKQLRTRHGGRAPFLINDEYDLQDLLHALLRIEFDDVRPEENSISYAGGGARMDFLLKNESMVVEAKCTRETLRDKQLGEELLVDIAKYRHHPNCKELVCFIYDPQEFVQNPHALERDLSGVREGLPVRVFVRPRH